MPPYAVIIELSSIHSAWRQVPRGTSVYLAGVLARDLLGAAEVLPGAVTIWAPATPTSAAQAIDDALTTLEEAVIRNFPHWLPGVNGIVDRSGANEAAVRRLALRLGSTSTAYFGPYVAILAHRSLGRTSAWTDTRHKIPTRRDRSDPRDIGGGRGSRPQASEAGGGVAPPEGSRVYSPTSSGGVVRFAPELRARTLSQLLADVADCSEVGLVVDLPAELCQVGQAAVVEAAAHLTACSSLRVCLVGAAPTAVDSLVYRQQPRPNSPNERHHRPEERDRAQAQDHLQHRNGPPGQAALQPPRSGVTVPVVAGAPHPASTMEKRLERALQSQPWAAGRSWNLTHAMGPLVTPFRFDLGWLQERLIVEIDGPEHGEPTHYEADRQRDLQFTLDGYTVVRFTNESVLADVQLVISQIELLLEARRATTDLPERSGLP